MDEWGGDSGDQDRIKSSRSKWFGTMKHWSDGPSHEQPVKMQYITVKNTSSLCCSAAHIINKGAPP